MIVMPYFGQTGFAIPFLLPALAALLVLATPSVLLMVSAFGESAVDDRLYKALDLGPLPSY